MTPGWFNDHKPVDVVPIDDRGFQYGDGLFETIAIRGGNPRLWQFHMERLAGGCERLGIRMPAEQDLRKQLATALDASDAGADNGTVKMILSAGGGPRGYARDSATQPRIFIGVFPGQALARSAYEEGVDAVVCETRLAGPSVLAGLKTLNRLEQVLGRAECVAANTFEGLMVDADERVICGTMSNVFIVIGQTLITPSLTRCGVAGVMRRLILESFAASDTAVVVRDVALEELRQSDEVFLSNSQFGVVPLRRCEDRQWSPGGMTRECQRLLVAQGVQECAL